MGMPIVIDMMALALGRFLKERDAGRTEHEHGISARAPRPEPSTPNHITLSSGQMLLPGMVAPHLSQR